MEAWAAPAGETPDDTALLADTDAVVVLGGDGTFLRAARSVAELDVPILGINCGKVGFLSKAEHQDLAAVLAQLKAGDYELEPRLMLEARVVPGSGGTTR